MAGLIDVGSIVGGIADIAGKFIKDPNKVMEFQLEVEKLADAEGSRLHDENLAQIEVNKAEAVSGSFWVAGARPFIIWVGGCSMAYSAIVYPFLMWGSRIFGYSGDFPQVDNKLITTVTLGVLGLGTQRMFEKKWGVSTNDFRSLPSDPSPAPEGAPPAKKKHFHVF